MPRRSSGGFALSDTAMGWAYRLVWAACAGVYLWIFLGGIQAGGAELPTLGRATGATLLTAFLGKRLLGLLDGAVVPPEPGPLAGQGGAVGSLAEMYGSTNTPTQVDEAARPDGER
jgi:hypothetical protein